MTWLCIWGLISLRQPREMAKYVSEGGPSIPLRDAPLTLTYVGLAASLAMLLASFTAFAALDIEAVDDYIEKVMELERIPGLAVAIVNEQVLHRVGGHVTLRSRHSGTGCDGAELSSLVPSCRPGRVRKDYATSLPQPYDRNPSDSCTVARRQPLD